MTKLVNHSEERSKLYQDESLVRINYFYPTIRLRIIC